jgi:hypothetical protein
MRALKDRAENPSHLRRPQPLRPRTDDRSTNRTPPHRPPQHHQASRRGQNQSSVVPDAAKRRSGTFQPKAPNTPVVPDLIRDLQPKGTKHTCSPGRSEAEIRDLEPKGTKHTCSPGLDPGPYTYRHQIHL